MKEWPYLVVALIDLLVVVYRVRLLYRSGGDEAMLWYCIGVSLGVPYTLLRLPDVHTGLSDLTSVQNIAHPIAMSVVLVACFLFRPLHQGLRVASDHAVPTRRTAATLLAGVTRIAVS